MRKLDPKTAANEIRNRVVNTPGADPMVLHMHKFVLEVCEHLGIEPSPPHFITVVQALEDAEIEPHQVVEYPKMLTENGKAVCDEHDHPIVFNSEQEENDYHHKGEAPKGSQERAANPTVGDVTTENPSIPKVVESPQISDVQSSPQRSPVTGPKPVNEIDADGKPKAS